MLENEEKRSVESYDLQLSPCLKFVIGRALTILSWDDPVTAFFEKVEKLRHSLGRPSRSDFVQFQFVGLLILKNQYATI